MKNRLLKTIILACPGITKRRSWYDHPSSLMMKNLTLFMKKAIYRGRIDNKRGCQKHILKQESGYRCPYPGLRAKYIEIMENSGKERIIPGNSDRHET